MEEGSNNKPPSRRAEAGGEVQREMSCARKLTRLLLVKAALDFVIVVWLVADFAGAAFTSIEAARIEKIDGELRGRFTLSGRERDREVQLFIDGIFVASTSARCAAEDVKSAARDGSSCAFSFTLPKLAAGEHEAVAYIAGAERGGARRVLRVVGEPVRFQVENLEEKRADARR